MSATLSRPTGCPDLVLDCPGPEPIRVPAAIGPHTEHSVAILSAQSPGEVCRALIAGLASQDLADVCVALGSAGELLLQPDTALDSARRTRLRTALDLRGEPGAMPQDMLELHHHGDGDYAVLLTRDGHPLPPLQPAQRRLALQARQRLAELGTLRHLHGAVRASASAEQLQGALFAIADMAGSDRDMPTLLKGLHDIIGKLMYAENFFIALYSPERDTLRFVYFADHEDPGMYDPEEELPASKMTNSLTLGLIRHGQVVHGSAREVAEILRIPGSGRGTPAVDFIGVPMVRAGQAVGAIVVQSYRDGARYTDSDCAVLSFVAEHVLNAVERKQGQQELEWRVEERTHQLAEANQVLQEQIRERERAEHLQSTLYRIAALANTEQSTAQFYRQIHMAVGELLNADNFYIALVADEGRTLDFPYYVDAKIQRNQARPFARGLSEYVIRSGNTLLADRPCMQAMIAAGDFDYSPAQNGLLSRCWLGVPLKSADGIIGVVVVQSYRDEHDYDAGDAELLTFVSYQIANTLQRRAHAEALQQLNAELEQRVLERTGELRQQIAVREQVEAQLKHQVMHDPLTGLPNRTYLRDRLEHAIANQRRHPERCFALMYLDVDRFKLFNDNLGHLAGDEVLRAVSARLQQCVREPDVVARLSGDEFAVLLEECATPQDACKVAQRIQQRLGAPLQVAGRELQLSASIGIAISEPRHEHIDKMLHDADIALYRAKAAGRQRFVLFDESLQKTAMDVLEVERQLRAALANDEFEPFFQPIVQLDDGRTVGYEALIRWRHPERGLLAPADFLQVAEDSGMIEAIDWHMYAAACRDAKHLVRDGGFITLNISPRHFQGEDFDLRLLALLEQTGFNRAQLRIEVTEGTLLGDPEAVNEILERLHAAGVGAALDDFGTGYSSLGYVHRFPLKMIKIDRSFVEPLGGDGTQRSRAIVEAVIALTGALELDVVAEGIETAAQRQALLDMGCAYGQGFLFGRPQAAAFWQASVGTR